MAIQPARVGFNLQSLNTVVFFLDFIIFQGSHGSPYPFQRVPMTGLKDNNIKYKLYSPARSVHSQQIRWEHQRVVYYFFFFCLSHVFFRLFNHVRVKLHFTIVRIELALNTAVGSLAIPYLPLHASCRQGLIIVLVLNAGGGVVSSVSNVSG